MRRSRILWILQNIGMVLSAKLPQNLLVIVLERQVLSRSIPKPLKPSVTNQTQKIQVGVIDSIWVYNARRLFGKMRRERHFNENESGASTKICEAKIF